MNVTISPCSLLSLVPKPFDRHLLTSLHTHFCWHFGNWIIAQAAVAVFVVSRSWLSSACSGAGGGVCMEGLFSLSPSQRVAQALTQNELSLLAPLKPFSSPEVPATLAAGR